MFPVKGTTVWVNFKDKPYLGKVLQTSPELDMVCVRISNYLDHVSRVSDETELVAHSCPVSNPAILSNRHSSVVVTCGLADICPIESNNDPHFVKTRFKSESQQYSENSENILESNPVEIPKNSDSTEISTDDFSTNRIQNFNSVEDDCDWSESFGINKLLRKAESDSNKQPCMKDKFWQCLHCHIYLTSENDMNIHVINKHKLDTFIDKDNWLIIGGIKGLDYDEVKAPEDINIRDLNNIHISTGSRKRQFLESASEVDPNLSNSYKCTPHLYPSSSTDFHKSDTFSSQNGFVNNYHEFYSQEIYWPNLNEVVNNQNNNYDYLGVRSNTTLNNLQLRDFPAFPDNQSDYEKKIQIFQNIILQHHLQSTLSPSLNNFNYEEEWPMRFRSHSISDQLIPNPKQWHSNSLKEFSETNNVISSPSKRSRLEIGVKKCRKMYGIDQRHLWCNQCKWKKACSRFSNELS